jgi:UDP-MurNAc hydroxylase
MRATSLGHACWLLETAAGKVLTDPVFIDPFEQGTVMACPSRKIRTDLLPSPDIIWISHRHLDHFDLPTLALLPKDLPTLAPDDPLTLAALARLGFTDLRPMRAWEPQVFNRGEASLAILPTPSPSEEFIEFGALFMEKGPEGNSTLYNQVDTPVTDESIKRILAVASRIDVHLAMYASQDFGWFNGKSERISEIYTRNLDVAVQIGARMVVPAAAGFRFVDEHAYLNQLLFPVPERRFLLDIRRLAPQSLAQAIDPGDIIEIAAAAMKVKKQGASFVSMTEDDRHLLRYDPTSPVPPLRDRNSGGYPLQHLHGFTTAVLDQGMVAYLDGALKIGEEVARQYQEHSATYRVEVVFPDGEKSWSYCFSDKGFKLSKGTDAPPPDALWRITASALLELCEGKKGCFAVRPDSRKWSKLLVAHRTPMGVRAVEVELPDLLTHFILNLRIRMKGEEQALLSYYGLA